MSHIRLATFLLLLFTSLCCEAQTDTFLQAPSQLPSNYLDQVSNKINSIDKKLSKQTLKALKKFERQETRLKRKLAGKDSATVKELFENSQQKLLQLKDGFVNMPDKAIDKLNDEYNAYLDTLKSTFKFLQQKSESLIEKSKMFTDKLSGTASKLNMLEGKLQKAEDIKRYLRERREIIKQQLEKFGMVKQLKQIDKSVYYYSQYINEYKNILKDKKKLERKAMALLYTIPAFKKFLAQNSMLTSLFPQSLGRGNLTQAQLMQGLQSRATVQQYLQNNVAAGGPNANQIIGQQLNVANAELSKLKEKIAKYGSDGEIPTFKANDLKTKSFFKRIEYGANIQFSKSSTYFPSTSDIAISLGYKLNNKGSAIGIGGSYKLGLGKGFDNIKLTSEGLSIRSYIDWKLKAQFFLSGGYEQNYLTAFRNIQQLSNNTAWVQSGLLGLSKKYQASKKVKGKAQILFDFLSNTHFPKTQAIIFRTGFNFK
jgi:hypothetical protein